MSETFSPFQQKNLKSPKLRTQSILDLEPCLLWAFIHSQVRVILGPTWTGCLFMVLQLKDLKKQIFYLEVQIKGFEKVWVTYSAFRCWKFAICTLNESIS